MWIIGTKGIYSIVAHRDDKDQLLVRSRCEADIDYFKSVMDKMGLEPLSSKVYGDKFDYPWRFYCRKDDVDAVVAKLVDDIEYTNFKSAAPHDRSSVLFQVYNALIKLDDRRTVADIGQAITPLTHTKSPLSGITDVMSSPTAEEEQLQERVEELEIALENAAYVIEGSGPAKSRRGKLKLADAIIRKGLWAEEPENQKLLSQIAITEEGD